MISVLDPAALPAEPVPVDAATRLSELLDDGLTRFAMTFDGYGHFGERGAEVLVARREEWESRGTLPRDVAALRGLLFLAFRQERFLELDHAPSLEREDETVVPQHDPEHITDARREHERFKHALLGRIRELAAPEATA